MCVSPIYEAGQKDGKVHSYNENLQSTFLKMLKCNFAMFSIWQASTWQTGVELQWLLLARLDKVEINMIGQNKSKTEIDDDIVFEFIN